MKAIKLISLCFLTLVIASFCFSAAYADPGIKPKVKKQTIELAPDDALSSSTSTAAITPTYSPTYTSPLPSSTSTAAITPTYSPTYTNALWSYNSYWHMKIGDNAPTHPNSDKMIAWLKSIASHNNGHPVIKYTAWTSPIYEVYEDRREVTVYNSYGTRVRYYNVPIPVGATPSKDADHLLTIIDWYKRETWDFWNLQYINGKWFAGAAYVRSLDGSGVSPDGTWTVGGAGIPLAAGIIRPEEIEAGVINHPLLCGLQTPKANSKVYPPAATADGRSYNTWAIPEGARIQLNPDLDLDSLGLSRTAKIIAKALQDYGMVVKESSGGFVIYAEHVLTADWTEWGLSGTLLYSLPAQWRIVDYSYFGATETYWGYP